MDKLKCPICYTEVEERNFKETYVSLYNNQEHKYYECSSREVLEHQDKSREFLEMIEGSLKERKYMVGSVPNRRSIFENDMYQNNSWVDNHPYHFLRFSRFSLEKALNFAEFKDIEVYKLDIPFLELFPYLGKKFFGNLDKLKIKLKSMVLGNKGKARAYMVEKLVEASPNKGKVYLFMMLKLIKNAIFLPFALGYMGNLKGNGTSIYFQAEI